MAFKEVNVLLVKYRTTFFSLVNDLNCFHGITNDEMVFDVDS